MIKITNVLVATDFSDASESALNYREQLKAVAAVRTGSSPAFEIAGYAKAEGVDIIVMGTHGRGLMGHLLMGSVAEKVVRIAPCPVLTVRHPEHEFIQPDALVSMDAVQHLR